MYVCVPVQLRQRVALCQGQLILLPLKVKDLIPVKFTPIADRDTKTATIVKQVSQEREGERERELGNSIPCAVLKPTYVCVCVSTNAMICFCGDVMMI